MKHINFNAKTFVGFSRFGMRREMVTRRAPHMKLMRCYCCRWCSGNIMCRVASVNVRHSITCGFWRYSHRWRSRLRQIRASWDSFSCCSCISVSGKYNGLL